MDEQTCRKCELLKPITSFRSRVRNNKVYIAKVCKNCSYIQSIDTPEKKEKLLESNRNRRKTSEFRTKRNAKLQAKRDAIKALKSPKSKQTKEERGLVQKEWAKNNPEKVLQYTRTFHSRHKEKERQYKIDNRDRSNLQAKDYRKRTKKERNVKLKEKRKEPAVKLRTLISSVIRQYIKRAKGNKNNLSCLKFLNYTINELKLHLESQFESWMTCDNHGVYLVDSWNDNDSSTWTWQIDHIIPQSELLYDSMDHPNFGKCWALDKFKATLFERKSITWC